MDQIYINSSDSHFIKQLEHIMPVLKIGLDRDSDNRGNYGVYHNEHYMIEIEDYVIRCELLVCEEERDLPRSSCLDQGEAVSSLEVILNDLRIWEKDIQVTLSKSDKQALKRLIERRIETY